MKRSNAIVWLAHGAVEEVIGAAHLTTWSVSGPDLAALATRLRERPGVTQAAAFGTILHVSGVDAGALEQGIAPFRKPPHEWRQVEPSLEDVFIQLMDQAPSNSSP
jgi:ABC-2 type transport system ATP-binding protein